MNTFKKKTTIFLIVFFCSLSPVIIAQQAVSGRITDADDGTPVPGASIFIANTTIGIASDASGNYSLTVPGKGSFEIVISHVGYQSVFHKVDVPQDAHQYNVSLITNELEEVTINAPKTYTNSDVNLFWQKILGEKPSKRGLEVLNPGKVYFYKSGNILRASCREPIEIVNHQMGYYIRYVLQSFEYDYSEKKYTLYGMPYFEELIPQNNRQNNRWKMKRQEVYAVSINHFLRALYREQIHEEGFVLANKTQYMNGTISPVLFQDIFQAGQDTTLLNVADTLLLLCYSKSIVKMIEDINLTISVREELKKSQYNTVFVYDYSFDHISKEDALNPNVVVELLPSQIIVYPDGTYKGLFTTVEYYNKSIFGLSAMLPVEYADSFFSFSPSTLFTEDISYDFQKIGENISAQLEAYPQEKIHLHTDRDFYVPGEKIWFKAYVVDAYSHLHPTYSQYVYVELISPADTLVSRVMVAQTDDMFYGHLLLTGIIPEGNYTLRAYTRYMENMGDDYFFKKNIRIGSLSQTGKTGEAGVVGSRGRINRSSSTSLTNRIEDDFDVSFYPEGGNLLEGVFCKIAFKAINKNGYPEMISGKITDENGIDLAYVESVHAGMGVLGYIPETGKRLFLKCRNANGLEKQFELPQPNPHAFSLAALWRNKKLLISAQRSVHAPEIQGNLLVHCRGDVLYFSEWDRQQAGVSLSEENLPAGVIQVILFDEQMNPLSERLIFSKNNASEKVEFHTDKEVYEKRDKVVSTLSFSDSFSLPLGEGRGGASISVAITDDQDITVDESTTILSSLLLSSELKGYIENPAYYLRDDYAMDLLMMTHGWRRYNVPELVTENMEHPQIPFQIFQEITGQVQNLVFLNPVPNSEISLLARGEVGITSTDNNGFFTFQDLDFPDSTTFYIQARNNKRNERDSERVKILIDNEIFPEISYAPPSPITSMKPEETKTKEESVIDVFIEKAEKRADFENDIWTMNIEEVAITAPRNKNPFDEPRFLFWANRYSDKTISKEDIDKFRFQYFTDYLTALVAGVRVIETDRGNINFIIRGINGIGHALVLVDGFEWDEISKYSIPVNDIESIDVFKNGIMFGMRGANGAISITTKRGSNSPIIKHNYAVHTPLGYQNPVEFYSPKYETLAQRQSPNPDYRTTIFWKPNVVISKEGEEFSFEFYTADFKTTYSVVIEGITDDGRIVRQVEKIRVE